MNGQNRSAKVRGVAMLIAVVAAAVFALALSTAFADEGEEGKVREPIVGFWQVTYKDATTGDVILHVWEAWHGDRTEMQNVSANPIGGNVCQGVWVPLGRRTYGLNHPAFIFLTTPEDQEGQLNTSYSIDILARVTVNNSGDKFTGTGIIKVVGGIDPLDPTAPTLGSENITMTGKRVTVDVSQLPPP